MNCTACGKPLLDRNTIGRCETHRHDNWSWPKRGCTECGKLLLHSNKSGHCPRHEYLDRDKVAEAARMRALRIASRDKIRVAERNRSALRRARLRGAVVEYVDRKIVWERDDGTCHICKLPADWNDWHLDHLVPLAKGGAHSYANTAVSHPFCNIQKGSR